MPAYDDDLAWDWEQLARQLSQVEIFADGNPMATVQLGWRNRTDLEIVECVTNGRLEL